MKNKITFLGFIVFVMALGFSLIGCNDGGNGNRGGMAFFLCEDNFGSRSARSARSVSGDTVELLVTRLMLKDDTREGGVWVIGGNEGGNPGWYDIEGLQKAAFGNQPQGRPHSCLYLSIKAIRINDNLYRFNEQPNSPAMIPFAGDKGAIPTSPHAGPSFDIIAGDLNKLGPGEHGGGVIPMEIPFQGVSGMQNIEEFIIIIDQSKLHDNGTLRTNWWESFSFFVN